MSAIPDVWRPRVRQMHERQRAASGWFGAQAWLESMADKLAAIKVPVSLSDSELCDLAERRARECMGLPGVAAGDLAMARGRMAEFCRRWGVEPPPVKINADGVLVGVTDLGAVRRMTCPQWWRRRLRVQQARALEQGFISLGLVHRRAQIYASDTTVQRRAQQKRRNAAALEASEAVNLDTGDVLKLSELVAKSNANPAIRRGELMVRIAGFEAVAKGLGHAAEFITITTPSSFHPKATGERGRVIDNQKWSKAGSPTPRDAQGYLVRIWAQIRAKLARLGVRPYGFRIAEPHHDGTPHWHMLLFVAADAVKLLRAVIRDYALRMDGNEPGAKKNRVEFVAIDWKRGSAAGYVAKYVSKNIDGYQVQGDLEGDNLDAVTGSQRVEAWAGAWGIRQFQQIGGAPVGVWRELRRMREPDDKYTAADAANWRRYVEIQGGPAVERKALRLRVAYTRAGERWRFAKDVPEPAAPTRYGDIAPPAVFGVRDVVSDRAFCSRFNSWQIRRNNHGNKEDGRTATQQLYEFGGTLAGVASGTGGVRAQCDAASEGNLRTAAGVGQPGRSGQGVTGFEVGPAAQPLASWSPVNNCTGVGDGRGRNEFGGGAGGDRRNPRGAGGGKSDVSGAGRGGD